MARKLRIDMTGQRYGRLVALSFSHRGNSGHAHWLFACDCGERVVAAGGNVRAGNTTSCGCLHREVSAARLTTHGRRAGRRHDATYRAWQLMIDARLNPAGSGYAACGGRGIALPARWRSDFTTFLADMGERPRGTILRRIDETGDFTPANCRWAACPSRPDRAAAGWERRRARAEAGSPADRSPAFGRVTPPAERRPDLAYDPRLIPPSARADAAGSPIEVG